jgi:hypothetical protein
MSPASIESDSPQKKTKIHLKGDHGVPGLKATNAGLIVRLVKASILIISGL